MARETFDMVIDKVLSHEGGFVNHPKDPGGATNKGITIKTFQQWRRTQGRPTPRVDDLRKITAIETKLIYRTNYWGAVQGDRLPAGIDYAVFDYSVNSGPGRAIKDLQRTLGVKPDGVIAAETIDAAHRAAAENEEALVEAYQKRRLAFLKSLKTFRTFGKGWSSRVEDVRKNGIQIARRDTLYSITPVAGANAKAVDKDRKVMSLMTSSITRAAASGGGVGAVGTAATDMAQKLEPFMYNEGLEMVRYLFLALMLVGFAISMYAMIKGVGKTSSVEAMSDHEIDEVEFA